MKNKLIQSIILTIIIILSFSIVNAQSQFIPLMVDSTHPYPYIVTQSSTNGGNNQGWGAFDNNYGVQDNFNAWQPSGIPSLSNIEWVQFDLGSSNSSVLTQLGMCTIDYSNTNYNPAGWEVLGSNDNSTYTLLENITNQAIGNNQCQNYTINNTNSYRYYKYAFFETTTGNVMAVSEIEQYFTYINPCTSLCNETCSPCSSGSIGTCTTTDFTDYFSSYGNNYNDMGDITNWNTSCITNMNSMFALTNFNQNISNWDTSNVIDMGGMFNNNIVFNQNISNWNTSSVTSFNSMFESATAFNYDISKWNISQVTDMDGMFLNNYMSISNYDKLLINWSNQQVQSNVIADFGSSQYSINGSSSRTLLITNYSWNITDNGLWLCTDVWIKHLGTCNVFDETKLIYYTENNSCNETINLPSDNNTYINCTQKPTTINFDSKSIIFTFTELDLIFLIIFAITIYFPFYMNKKEWLGLYFASGIILGIYTIYVTNKLFAIFTTDTMFVYFILILFECISAILLLIGFMQLIEVFLNILFGSKDLKTGKRSKKKK